ncbi:MAG: patatin-like phospholipase family protein [Bacteroidota bacterium]
MRKTTTLLLSLSLFLGSYHTLAQTNRPKIGYAFGGGGAKGIAEIGVLKVLEEAGIRPDYITGTSIGSIVGGLYAIGYSVEELEALANEIDWNYYFNDELSRTDLPIEERLISDRYQLKLNIENGKIRLPGGFVQGQKVGLLLSQLTLPVHGVDDFDDFDIPFRCVAADFETGDPIVLGSGSLAKSIRASMSIPSIFEPIEIDGKLLIDGGVVRNLPVQEVKEMGADIIIAIDVTSPLYKKEELSSFMTVLEQAGSYRLAASIEASKEMADIFIHPAIDEFGALDFDNADTLMTLGEQAAREKLPEILALLKEYLPTTLNERGTELPETYDIDNIYIKGTSESSRQLSDKIANVSSRKGFSIEKVEDRITRLFGSNYIKDAYYEVIEGEEGLYELDIDANLQSGKYIQISANYDSDLKAALLFNATYRSKGVRAAKFSIDAKLSENPLLLADYIVHSNTKSVIGLNLNLKLNHYPAFYYDEDGDPDEAFNINHYSVGMDLFKSLSRHTKVGVGIGLERYAQRVKIFEKSTEELQLNQAITTIGFVRDNRDRPLFPTEGSLLSLDGKLAFAGNFEEPIINRQTDLGSINKMLRFQFRKVFSLKPKFAVEWDTDAGWIGAEQDNFLNLFYLGREVPGELTHTEFIGLDYAELAVTAYALSRIKLRFQPKPNVYTSLMFNYGQYQADSYLRVVEEESNITESLDNDIMGLGGELGFITPLGPGRVTAEYNLLENRTNFSLHLGYAF